MPKKSRAKADTAKARGGKERRARRTALFPAVPFEEALTIAKAIQKHAAGQKVRRLTLFDQMEKAPDSGPSRQLITNSRKYGLTTGSYQAEHLELTQNGRLATGADIPPRDKAKARFRLAIENIAPFKALYETQVGNRLPANSVLEDVAKEHDIPALDAKECVEIFIVNAKYVGVLRPIAGAERIIPLDQVLEELPDNRKGGEGPQVDCEENPEGRVGALAMAITGESDLSHTCFYISPIGDDESEQRQHSDLFLGSLVEPALEEFKLKVVRADQIGQAGMISRQIIEHVLRARLVVADLSYHNPNVFYELCLRHVSRLPTVHIIRKADKIPFDIDQFRTIRIDTSSIFTMVPNLQTYQAEMATQIRQALKDPDSADNPVSTYYPNLKVQF